MIPSSKPAAGPAYPPTNDEEQASLRDFVRGAPLAYGTWRGLKGLYKRLEADPASDTALLGALIGRLDDAPLSAGALGSQRPAAQLGGGLRNVSGLAVSGARAYVLGSQWGTADKVVVFDLAPGGDPLKPRRLAALDIKNAFQIVIGDGWLAVLRGTGYAGTGYAGTGYAGTGPVEVYALGGSEDEDARPRLVGQFAINGDGRLCASGGRLYVTINAQRKGAFSGLRVVDVAAFLARGGGGDFAATDLDIAGATNVIAQDGLAVVAVGRTGFGWTSLPRSGGVRIVDVSEAARPRVAGSLDLGEAKTVALQGRLAFVGIGRSGQSTAGVQVVDISDPARPRKLGFCPLPPDADVLAVHKNILYAGTQYSGLFIFDISEPEAPKAAGKVANVSYLSDLVVQGQTLYAASQYTGMALFDLTNPAKPARIGTPPSSDTLGYMKRRARRLLKKLSVSDPARYVALAAAVLAQSGRGADTLHPGRHWAALDVLGGGSGRLVQKRHGRGAVIETRPGSRLRLRTREERAPHAWDARPDLAAGLLTLADPLPWQTHEFAVRVLRANRVPLPDLPYATLERWLESPSPLLVSFGVRRVAEQSAAPGRTPTPQAAAAAFFHASASLRQRLRGVLDTAARNDEWAKSFASHLADRVRNSLAENENRLSARRAVGAAALLAAQFVGKISGVRMRPLAAALLATGRADLIAFVVAGARQVAPVVADEWLRALEPAPAGAAREAVLSALEDAVRDAAFNIGQARALVHNNPLAFVRENGWRLLAASRATTAETLRAVWEELFAAPAVTPALETAMASPHALGVLERAGIGPDELANRLAERPFLVGLLTPQAFTRVAATAPGAAVLALVAAAPDELWERLRPAWLRNLREGVGLETVWLAVETAIASDATGRIVRRLIEDPEIAQTFLDVDNPAVLAFREPALDALLGQWARVHENRFTPRSPLLLDAAIHALPNVRAWALAHARETGLDLPFALRLLESGVPPSVALGRTFFEATAPGDPSEFTFALALCDSPQAPVRAFGREYVVSRWPTLPHAAVLRALFENPEPDIQTFVAEKLGQVADDAPRPDETAAFDRDVLKTTNRARRAKEQIKARQTAQPTLDPATLLALARRADTPRDADWALAELARRALAGETIEGVTVEGVAGV